ncbi:hypothetical protein [Paractinoplanes brasiliensis]|uniref:Uncharacterized protein n=1 Tax=Paractinoplanes brasiliensis TaxID=52695 RepID=A0A4R6JRB5_9ACTN|nr:hypothetical protein [Actinoplanes brasiliensis]TDO37941.1 hypothetical protein C8E87_1579 [Actinoplanes brasiliensis]GID31031.1 hypothetical protein Abr02nite_60140 [Actinoplanes brasiliensis]
MFSSRTKSERTAAQAWEYLSAAMAAAGDTARDTGDKAAKLAGKASDQGHKLAGKSHKLAGKGHKLAGKASGKADLAWTRANAAAAALAGRKPSRPWGLILGAGLLGAAVGYAVATSARAALERQAEQEELELAETAVVVTPTYDN